MRNLITKTLDLFKNKIFKETFWSFAAKAVAFFFFYLLQFYLARKLSVDDLGKWGFFFSFFSVFLVLSDAGLNSSTSKFIAQYSDTSAVNSVLLSALQLRLLLSFAFMAIYLLLLNPFLAIIQKTYLFQLFFWAFPLVLLNGLVEFLSAVFVGFHRLFYNFIIKFNEHFFKLLFTLIFLGISINLVGIVHAFILANIIAVGLGIGILLIFFKKIWKTKTQQSYRKQLFIYSIPMLFVMITSFLSSEIDTFMINLLKGDYETGIYYLAKQITIHVPQISIAFSMSIMPVFAKINDQTKAPLKSKFFHGFYLLLLVYAAIALVLILLAPLLPKILKQDFERSILVLQLLCPHLLFTGMCIYMGYFFIYIGIVNETFHFGVIAMVANIALNLLLIPRFGAYGAAIATSFSQLLLFLLALFKVRQVFNI